MTKTVLLKPAKNGTIVATYHDRRGIIEFRQGGRAINGGQINVEPYISISAATTIARNAVSDIN